MYWGSPVDGAWDDPMKWQPHRVPDSHGSVRLESGATPYTVTLTSTSKADKVYIGHGSIGGLVTLAVEVPGGSLKVKRNLDLGAAGVLAIDTTPGSGGSKVHVLRSLLLTGVLAIGNSELSAPVNLTVGHLFGSSITATPNEIDLTGSATVEASLDDVGDTVLLGLVTLHLAGDALLELASGDGITSLYRPLSLDGANARIAERGQGSSNTALTHLGFIDTTASLTLANGASIATVTDMVNLATIDVDSATGVGGSNLAIGGRLTSGQNPHEAIRIGNAALSSSALVEAQALQNYKHGVITLIGGSADATATLHIHGDSLNRGTVSIGSFAVFQDDGSYVQNGSGETDVMGTLSAAQVSIGGLIEGTGTITGAVTISGGTIAGGVVAGGVPGRLSIDGDLTVNGTVEAELTAGGSGSASLLAVQSGDMVLGKATLRLDIADPENLQAGETFTLATFTPGDLEGTFRAIKAGSLSGDGTGIDLGNGLSLAAHYDNAVGDIQLVVTETADAFTFAAHTLSEGDTLTDALHRLGPVSDLPDSIAVADPATVALHETAPDALLIHAAADWL